MSRIIAVLFGLIEKTLSPASSCFLTPKQFRIISSLYPTWKRGKGKPFCKITDAGVGKLNFTSDAGSNSLLQLKIKSKEWALILSALFPLAEERIIMRHSIRNEFTNRRKRYWFFYLLGLLLKVSEWVTRQNCRL